MKAISLMQPHATLVALNIKRIETRSWKTVHRGPIAIHASKTKNLQTWNSYADLKQFIYPDGVTPENGYKAMIRGNIVAFANLIDCVPVTSLEIDKTIWRSGYCWKFTKDEKSCGDYTVGRYAWLMADIVKLTTPIQAKGALSLWDFIPPQGLLEAPRMLELFNFNQ